MLQGDSILEVLAFYWVGGAIGGLLGGVLSVWAKKQWSYTLIGLMVGTAFGGVLWVLPFSRGEGQTAVTNLVAGALIGLVFATIFWELYEEKSRGNRPQR